MLFGGKFWYETHSVVAANMVWLMNTWSSYCSEKFFLVCPFLGDFILLRMNAHHMTHRRPFREECPSCIMFGFVDYMWLCCGCDGAGGGGDDVDDCSDSVHWLALDSMAPSDAHLLWLLCALLFANWCVPLFVDRFITLCSSRIPSIPALTLSTLTPLLLLPVLLVGDHNPPTLDLVPFNSKDTDDVPPTEPPSNRPEWRWFLVKYFFCLALEFWNQTCVTLFDRPVNAAIRSRSCPSGFESSWKFACNTDNCSSVNVVRTRLVLDELDIFELFPPCWLSARPTTPDPLVINRLVVEPALVDLGEVLVALLLVVTVRPGVVEMTPALLLLFDTWSKSVTKCSLPDSSKAKCISVSSSGSKKHG